MKLNGRHLWSGERKRRVCRKCGLVRGYDATMFESYVYRTYFIHRPGVGEPEQWTKARPLPKCKVSA